MPGDPRWHWRSIPLLWNGWSAKGVRVNPQEIKARVAEIRWHHSIDLGHGLVTPGQDNSARKLKRLRLPESLAGKTVLDVGAWDGFFSFEAERRGALRVLATDSYSWNGSHDWGDKRGFNLARQVLGSKVEDRDIDVLALSPDRVGTFDVVLFLGVLYQHAAPDARGGTGCQRHPRDGRGGNRCGPAFLPPPGDGLLRRGRAGLRRD